MIYAIRLRRGRQTLVEMESLDDIKQENERTNMGQGDASYMLMNGRGAHRWVRDGREHETGLFIEKGRMRYAHPQS